MRFGPSVYILVLASFLLASATAPAAEPAEGDDVTVIQSMGIGEGYEGNGKVRFDRIWLSDQIVHRQAPREIPLRLNISYEVIETAPILLNSRYGTEYWEFMHYETGRRHRLYTVEDVDLRKPGKAVARTTEATSNTDAFSSGGLVGIRSHHHVLIDRPNREWIDLLRAPAKFLSNENIAPLTFTLADLSEYRIEIADVESTWRPGGVFRARMLVTDATGERHPVVNAEAVARAGDWQVPMTTELNRLRAPSGWMACALPEEMPDAVEVTMTVSAMTPRGPETRTARAAFRSGEGLVMETDTAQEIELPRTADGRPIETRMLWVHSMTYNTPEKARDIVRRAKAARLNVICPDIYVSALFQAKSERYPSLSNPDDPLGLLIEAAEGSGLEVHAWFCVTHINPAMLADIVPGVELITRDGEPGKGKVDIHRREYRDFIVSLIEEVATNYEVDGVLLDYIRSMGTCYCDDCRREFRAEFGKPIEEATDDDLEAWHARAVWDIVERASKAVRAMKPDAPITMAAVRRNNGVTQGQHPEVWVERGWVDVVSPMDYTLDLLELHRNERRWQKILGENADHLVTSLCMYTRDGGNRRVRDAHILREQIREIRRLGISGYNLFDSNFLQEEIIRLLREEMNPEEAVPHFRQ